MQGRCKKVQTYWVWEPEVLACKQEPQDAGQVPQEKTTTEKEAIHQQSAVEDTEQDVSWILGARAFTGVSGL